VRDLRGRLCVAGGARTAYRDFPHTAPHPPMPPNSHIRAGRRCGRRRAGGWHSRGGRRVVGSARGSGACVLHRGYPPLLFATSCRPTPASEQGSGENGQVREGRDPRGRHRVAGGARSGGVCMAHQDLPPLCSSPPHTATPPHWSGAAVRAAERGRGGIWAGAGWACVRYGWRHGAWGVCCA
jgi:hypothetical protein